MPANIRLPGEYGQAVRFEFAVDTGSLPCTLTLGEADGDRGMGLPQVVCMSGSHRGSRSMQ